ncbi:MAG: InlB B-repeat-containing protein [Methanobrevibacter sp.]|nr:InlB B-repeat-containing protein [Methanobrevibacter sp.]
MENQKSDKRLRNRKSVKGLFTILVVVVMMFSLVPATAIGTNIQNTDTTDSSSVQITVKAKAASCKITWNGNSGKIGSKKTTTTTVKMGAKIGKLPTTPKLTGHSFKGWYTKKSGGTKVTKNTIANKKVTYHAQWLKQCTLTFDPNGGSVKTKTKKVTQSKTYGTLPTPTRSRYTFAGWFTAETGGKKVTSATQMSTKNVKIYAQWKRVLSDEEKKLVGAYSYGSSGGGYWTYYSYNYDQWKGGYTYMHGINFKSDGTYEGFTLAVGSGFTRGGSYIKATANWHISAKGTVTFSNMVQNVQYNDGTTSVWLQSQHPDWNPNDSYTFTEENGKKGIERWGSFYEKV